MLLDARFKCDKATELPEVFEEYLFKSNRRPREFMSEYIQQIRLSTRKVQQFRIDLPDEIRRWLLLRRAGLNEEHKMLVMSQVGMNLMFERVAFVLQSTIGQLHVLTDRMPWTPAVQWTTVVENDHPHREYHDTLWTDNQTMTGTTVNLDPVETTSKRTMTCSARTCTREHERTNFDLPANSAPGRSRLRGDASLAAASRTWKREVGPRRTNRGKGKKARRASDQDFLCYRAWKLVRRVFDADRQDTIRLEIISSDFFFLNYLVGSNSIFVAAEIFFERFEFLVSKVQSHTMWPYMCLCCGLFVPTQFHFE